MNTFFTIRIEYRKRGFFSMLSIAFGKILKLLILWPRFLVKPMHNSSLCMLMCASVHRVRKWTSFHKTPLSKRVSPLKNEYLDARPQKILVCSQYSVCVVHVFFMCKLRRNLVLLMIYNVTDFHTSKTEHFNRRWCRFIIIRGKIEIDQKWWNTQDGNLRVK